jgi:hypothetical protein
MFINFTELLKGEMHSNGKIGTQLFKKIYTKGTKRKELKKY